MDNQAKLEETLAEIKQETAKLEEAKRVKWNEAVVNFNNLIAKNIAEFENFTK